MEAESLYRRVIGIRQRAAPEQSLVHLLTNRAGLLGRTGRGAEAERNLRAALAINTRVYGAISSQTAAALSDLSDEWLRQGRPTEAERIARDVLATRRRTLAPSHSHIGLSLTQIGGLRLRQGAPEEAKRLAGSGGEVRAAGGS